MTDKLFWTFLLDIILTIVWLGGFVLSFLAIIQRTEHWRNWDKDGY